METRSQATLPLPASPRCAGLCASLRALTFFLDIIDHGESLTRMETLNMERRELRDARVSAPESGDLETDVRDANPAPLSAIERQVLRNRIAHFVVNDEAHKDELIKALERVRQEIDIFLRHESRWETISKLSVPSGSLKEVLSPTSIPVRPDSLGEIWRQVGGYISESVNKVRSGTGDE